MKNTFIFLFLLTSFFTPNTASSITLYDDVSSVDAFLPMDIAINEVATFELIEADQVSSIYKITTFGGKTIYQTVSMAALGYLPKVAELVCLAVFKNPTVCTSVYYAGEAIITIFNDDISKHVEGWWGKARISGNEGIASVTTSSLVEAQEAQKAFIVSREKTNFPWQKPVVRKFSNLSKRMGF